MRLIAPVLRSAGRATVQPAVLVPSAAATLGSTLAFRLLGAGTEFWMQPPGTMAALIVVLLARFWVGLCVTATALGLLRKDYARTSTYWVNPITAFEVGVVTAAVVVPIAAATLFLIIPGIWLALRWSQAMLLILDDRAQWFGAVEASADLVHGAKFDLFVLWLLVGGTIAVLGWLFDPGPGGSLASMTILVLHLGLRVMVDAFGLCLLAATYHELDRAPAV